MKVLQSLLSLVLALILGASACPAGYSCSGGANTPCPAGTFSPDGQASCTTCPNGNYCPAASGSPIQCPPGTYQFQTGQESCTVCPVGNYCPNFGQTSTTTCITNYHCPPGSYIKNQCPPGYYCPDGATINPCPAGTYNSAVEKISPSDCQQCQAGYGCPQATGTINPCSYPTFYQPNPGKQSCQRCPAAHYCSSSTVANPCASGTSSDTGSGLCATTSKGYQCNTGTSSSCANSVSKEYSSCSSFQVCPSAVQITQISCTASRNLDQYCLLNSDCFSNNCINNFCAKGLSTSSCSNSQSCASGLFCDSSGSCIAIRNLNDICNASGQCSIGSVCRKNNTCTALLTNGQPCTIHRSCLSGFCSSNICAASPITCQAQSNCPFNYTCIGGFCSQYKPTMEYCDYDSDCYQNSCIRNTCVDPFGFSCDTANGPYICQYPNESCSGGKCVRFGRTNWPCFKHIHCFMENYFCNIASETCQPRLDVGGTCTHDLTCKKGLSCVNKICTTIAPVSGSTSCVYDQECGTGMYCSNESTTLTCQTPLGEGAICESASECAFGLTCIYQNQFTNLTSELPIVKKCGTPLSENMLCTAHSECTWPLFCEDSKCQSVFSRSDGTASINPNYCDTNYIHNNICATVSIQSKSFPYTCTEGQLCSYDVTVGSNRVDSFQKVCEVTTTGTGYCPIVAGMVDRKTSIKSMMDLISVKGNSSYQIPDVAFQSTLLDQFEGLISCTSTQDRTTCENVLESLYKSNVYPLTDSFHSCLVTRSDYWKYSALLTEGRAPQPTSYGPVAVSSSEEREIQFDISLPSNAKEISTEDIELYWIFLLVLLGALVVILIVFLIAQLRLYAVERDLQKMEKLVAAEEKKEELKSLLQKLRQIQKKED